VLTISFDHDAHTYVLNTRHPRMNRWWRAPSVPAPARPPNGLPPYHPDEPRLNSKRRIFQARSSDLLHWSEPQPIAVPDDELDNLDDLFYGMKQYDLGGMWVGFLDVFHSVSNTMDVQLLYSRDGRTFHRVHPGRPWLPHGESESWDRCMVNAFGGPVEVDEELWVYHGGARNHHDWWLKGPHEGLTVPEATDMGEVSYGLGLARMKRNRFVGLAANEVREGLLVTHPMYIEGGRLLVNAQCGPQGYIDVEAARGDGQVLQGFERERCERFAGDATAHEIRWQGGVELSPGWVRLHFYMRDAELYTFLFSPGRSDTA
jgi:hypothetical protein